MGVKNKILRLRDRLGPLPYFFPLQSGSTPRWDNCWPSVLLAYGYLPTRLNRDNTLVMVESGGYVENPPADWWECLLKQMRTYPDLALTLDLPTKMKTRGRGWYRLPRGKKERRLAETIRNAEHAMAVKEKIMSDYNHQYEPVAVIQGDDLHSIRRCTEEMRTFGYNYYALGAITTSPTHRNVPKIIEQIVEVRDLIGKDAWLHLLGFMDVKILRKVKRYITSFDASSLTLSGAYATQRRKDGSTIRLPKHLRPKKTEDYLKLQEENFKNYIEQLKRDLWT